MRILDVLKRVVPFVLTLALGISVATVFYAFTSFGNNTSEVHLNNKVSYEKKVKKYKKKKKKKCRYKREYRSDY